MKAEPWSPLWACLICGQQNGELRERCKRCRSSRSADACVVAVYTSEDVDNLRKFAKEMFGLDTAPTLIIDAQGVQTRELGFEANLSALKEACDHAESLDRAAGLGPWNGGAL